MEEKSLFISLTLHKVGRDYSPQSSITSHPCFNLLVWLFLRNLLNDLSWHRHVKSGWLVITLSEMGCGGLHMSLFYWIPGRGLMISRTRWHNSREISLPARLACKTSFLSCLLKTMSSSQERYYGCSLLVNCFIPSLLLFVFSLGFVWKKLLNSRWKQRVHYIQCWTINWM